MINIGKILLVISDIQKEPRWEVRLFCGYHEQAGHLMNKGNAWVAR